MKKNGIAVTAALVLCTAVIGCADRNDAHEHEYEWDIVSQATCTETGLRTGVCSCGSTTDEIIPLKDHEYGEWSVLETPCDVGGTRTRECGVCGHEESQSVAAGEHSYGDYIGDAYGHYKVCAKCGDTTETAAHTPPDGVCTLCGYESATATLTYELVHDDGDQIGDYYKVTGMETPAARVEIPDTYNGLEVREIGEAAFQSTDIASVTIGGNVTVIADKAFSNCEKLTTVKLGDSVSSIGKYAFQLSAIDEIVFPSSVTSLGYCSFSKTPNLKTVTLPSTINNLEKYVFWDSGLTSVFMDCEYKTGASTFYQCASLKSATIGKNVKSTVWWAFDNVSALEEYKVEEGSETYAAVDGVLYSKSMKLLNRAPLGKKGVVDVPEGVTRLNTEAFRNCTFITGVNMPSTLETVGQTSATGVNTFSASGVTKLEFPEACVNFGNNICNNCTALTEVSFGANVQNLSAQMFKGCTALNKVTVDPANTVLSSQNNCIIYTKNSSVQLVLTNRDGDIPSGINEIGDYSFILAQDIESVTVPEGVKSIYRAAFQGCSALSSVSLPSTLMYIDSYAFADCTALQSITIPAAVKQISSWAFQGCTALTSATFAKTAGWTVGYSSTGGEALTLSSPAVAASYLTDEYYNKTWWNM